MCCGFFSLDVKLLSLNFYVFLFLEIWILYCGKEEGLLKVVREVYKSYEEMEFKIDFDKKKEMDDKDRYVKFIKIVGIKVIIYVGVYCNVVLIVCYS